MPDINHFEVIQNKLDALVEKIVQKENSDEDFRITYAQILEKINTKMDVFSNDDASERINILANELGVLIRDRQDVIESRFNAVKGEFDNINNLLNNCVNKSDLSDSFNKIQNNMFNFVEEQKNQSVSISALISKIEGSNLSEDIKETLENQFFLVKEQNSVLNDSVTNCFELITQLNNSIDKYNTSSAENINNILAELKDFSVVLEADTNELGTEIKSHIDEKLTSIVANIQEVENVATILNDNLSSVVNAIENIFDNENFDKLKSDVANIFVKTSFLSESIKQIATKDDIVESSTKNKEELKEYNLSLINELEQKLLKKLDFSALDDIKAYTEKMFFQGTEVLKEEMWAVKDSFSEFNQSALKQAQFATKVDELKADITDVISEESVATSNQLNEIASSISSLKNAISDIILNEQNEQITSSLQNLQSKFVTQLVQIADNISFVEEADELHDNIVNCTEELKDKISADIADIKNDITSLHGNVDLKNENIIDLLTKIENSVQSDVSNDLKTLISGLKILTTGLIEDQDHLYTMPDIESDLDKIRLDLNKIQSSLTGIDSDNDGADIISRLNNIKIAIEKLEENNIDKDISEIKAVFTSINEDIASISKRTNKLILASDEVSKTLKTNISAFSMLLGSFERQSREFYNSAFMLDLNDRIENLSRMTSSLVQSDHALNEAFMYIGEWIDSTSDSFDELRADVIKIKKSLGSEDSTDAEKLEFTVNSLAQKIELQDSKIDAIDDKLNKLSIQMQESKEIKSLLEYVASQVSLTNEKVIENEKLAQKIASMEKQLKKIEKNVTAITEYLDEDSDEYYEE